MASSSCDVNVTEMEYEYEVFISFRGTDVRRGLLSHLKKELHREKIGFYVDDELERGDEISSSLLMAIEESQILLVIFSKDFASSKWCLDELVKMMECQEKKKMRRNKQIVIPIFYKIDPSDVRNQKGDYGAALAKHQNGKKDMTKVQNWRSTLNKAAQLSGFHYPLNSEEDESDFVDKIVKDVSKKLSKYSSSELDDPTKSNGLVGIDQNIAWIKPLLTTESDEVQKIGIWGMGGIGKTTIARVVFEKLSPQYEGRCFLENIRDDLKNQLSNLREKLVFELLGEENPHIKGRGKTNSNMRKLRRMKVLIVLDDVNTPNLLKDFLEPLCFGPGSKVIVTSRNKQVFTAGGFQGVHKVKELNFGESLKLFCINAFNENQPKMGYEEQSKKAVAIIKGIPLALKVFGSYLHSKSQDIWECALEKLKKYPGQNIQRALRLSYDDGLDDVEKNIFLDIAFFFKDEDKDYVIKQLNAWGFYGTCGIEALQDKALINISNDNRIQMHDLIQDIGWEIVRQESTDPRRRSRLRNTKEVYEVLKNNEGSDSVEGMLLDISQIRDVALNVDSLKRMPKLRLLKFYAPLPVEVPMQIRYFVPDDFMDVNLKRMQVDDTIEEMGWEIESKEYGRWSQPWDNEDTADVFKTNKGTHVVDEVEILDTVIKMHILRMIKLNLPMHVEHPMLSLPIAQDFMNVKGSVLDIPKQFVKLQKLSKLPRIYKLLNYDEYDGVLILKTNNMNGSNQSMPLPNLNIGSTLKELMSLGSDIHIKSLHYLFMEGCSVSKDFSLSTKEIRSLISTGIGMETLNSSTKCSDTKCLGNVRTKESSVLPNEMRQLDLTDTRMELLNSSMGNFISLECSDADGVQLETLQKELPFVRSTCYYRLSNSGEQDTGKPKLLVLFDGFRYSQQMSFLILRELSFPLDGSCKWSYLWSICDYQWLLFFHSPRLIIWRFANWLKLIDLDGSDRGMLSLSLRHIEILSLWGYRFLSSKTSIWDLNASNWLLLGTKFSSNTAGLHEIEHVDISFQIEVLILKGSSVKKLPWGSNHFSRLRMLSLRGCRFLKSIRELPPSIEYLDASRCLSLETVEFSSNAAGSRKQEDVDSPFQIKVLILDGSSVKRLPWNIKHFSRLKELLLRRCRFLQSILELPPSIEYLDASNCLSLETVEFSSNTAGSREQEDVDISFQIKVLILDGSSVKRLPWNTKHFLRLQHLSLTGCRFLQSIPELPPSIRYLDASNCLLLETVEFSSNTARPHEQEHVDISFKNCTSLDAKKIDSLFLQYGRVPRENIGVGYFRVCYPGSKVPEWFPCCNWGTSITFELTAPSNDLFGCLLCLVLRQSTYTLDSTIKVECQSYREDGNMPRYATKKRSLPAFWGNLNSDHVCMWYLDSGTLRGIIKGTANDQCTSSSCDLKVTLQFSFEVVERFFNFPKHADGLIKECGVYPLYLTDYHSVAESKRLRMFSVWRPLKLEMEFGDSLAIDDEHKLPADQPVPMFLEQTGPMQMEEVEMKDIVEEPILNIDNCNANNHLAVVEYIEDLHSYYRKIESISSVSPNYMAQQFDINERMRAILVDWLVEVHYVFDLMQETLFLTINLIDRFLAKQTVVRKKLQLVGVVAMLLACKYVEVSVPLVGDLAFITDGACTREEVLEMEKLMLNTLQFNMSVPTAYVFMRRFPKAAQADRKLELLAFFLVELSLVEYEMLKFPPSMLAAAAVYTAQCTVNGFKHWSKTCEWHTKSLL